MKCVGNKAILTALIGLAVSGSTAVYGADATTGEVYDFGESITTASRMTEQKIDVPADTTVITADAIDKGNYSKVSDALKANNIPVVQKGFAAYPEINGDTRVLVMVNGRRMNWDHLVVSGASNAVNIDQIPMENIERIEVVKGPNSALYGERAVAGVINIITKAPEEGAKTTVRAEYGTWKERRASVLTQGGDTNDRYMFSYSKERRNNYDYKDANGNTHEFPDSYINRDTMTARYDHLYADDRLSFDFSRSEKKDGYGIYLKDPLKGTLAQDGNKHHVIDASYGVTYTFGALTEGEGTFVRAYRNTEKTSSGYAGGSSYGHDLSIDVLEGQKTWELGKHTVVAGTTYSNEHIQETNDGISFDKKAVVKAVFAEDKWDLGSGWALNYGTRFEHHDTFGSDWASHVGLNKKLGDRTHMYLAWGQAVNNPSLKMLYANTKWWRGNPDLKQERSRTTTLGIDSQVTDKLSVSASVYDSRLKNAQSWVNGHYIDEKNDIYAPGYYINANREKRRGLNLSATYKFNDAWSVRGAYKYSKIEQDTGSGYTDWTDNREPNAYDFEVTYDKDRWYISSLVRYVTGRAETRYTDSSYVTWDMNVNYRVNNATKFYVKGFNLTNESYETVPNATLGAYAMPERHFVFGVEHTF